ncbi:MAG: OsmC family protein [Bacteroidales bacterium]|nr:OsmC family protein [Bacteroidales bacterium]
MNIEVMFGSGKKVNAYVNNFEIKTDQSPASGGEGSAPEPFTLFLASIATCAGIYVKSFCDQRGIPSEEIKLVQKSNFNPEKRLIDRINIEIQLPPDFPDKYKEAVIKSANLCAVKKHLHDPPEILVVTN